MERRTKLLLPLKNSAILRTICPINIHKCSLHTHASQDITVIPQYNRCCHPDDNQHKPPTTTTHLAQAASPLPLVHKSVFLPALPETHAALERHKTHLIASNVMVIIDCLTLDFHPASHLLFFLNEPLPHRHRLAECHHAA